MINIDYKAHLTVGIALGIGTVYLSQKANLTIQPLLLIGGSAIGSLLPDIDHPKSYLGNKVPIIPTLLYTTVGHRSLTHSLLFAAIMGTLLGLIDIPLGIGMFIGIISHILLDMLTPQGVSYLYPFKKKRIKWFKFRH